MNGDVNVFLKGQGIEGSHVLSIPMHNTPGGFVLGSGVCTWIAICSNTAVSVIFGFDKDAKIFVWHRVIENRSINPKWETCKVVSILSRINVETKRWHVIDFDDFFPKRLDDIHDFDDIGS
jgi:hypothetical protein